MLRESSNARRVIGPVWRGARPLAAPCGAVARQGRDRNGCTAASHAGAKSDLPDVRKSSKASSYFLSNFLAIIASRGGLAGADSRSPGIDPTLAQPGEKHDTGATNTINPSRQVTIVCLPQNGGHLLEVYLPGCQGMLFVSTLQTGSEVPMPRETMARPHIRFVSLQRETGFPLRD